MPRPQFTRLSESDLIAVGKLATFTGATRLAATPTEGDAAMVTEEQAWEALKQIEDPELGLNIVDLGLVSPGLGWRRRGQCRAGVGALLVA
jgi:hypothetical protein